MTFVAPPEIIKALAISVANVTERYKRFRFSNYTVQTFVVVQFSKNNDKVGLKVAKNSCTQVMAFFIFDS